MTSTFATYAVDLSNDGVSLWHRSPNKAWKLLGKVSLRSTNFSTEIEALKDGHKPDANGWYMAQVRVPRSEVFVSVIDLGGALGAKATSKTKEFLTQSTPYSADELVFDLETPQGSNNSYVAAITKQTIEEAKEFILEYGFKALYYTSKFDKSDFPRNPRFFDGDRPGTTTQSPVAKSTPAQNTEPDDTAVPAPPPLRAKAENPKTTTSPDIPKAAPVAAVKTDLSDFASVRSKILIADKTKDDDITDNTWTPPPPRISISAPTKPTYDTNQDLPKPVASSIIMPQAETLKPNVRGVFKLRYILIFTAVLLITLLYWFYSVLFDGKATIARLQAPPTLSEPIITPSPLALKHKASKDLSPTVQHGNVAQISQIPALKAPGLMAKPVPIIIAGDTPKVATVFNRPGTDAGAGDAPDIADAAPEQLAPQKPAVNTLTETTKTVEIPDVQPTQQNIVVASLPPETVGTAKAEPETAVIPLIPTTSGTNGPEGITLFAGQPDIVPPMREQLTISTDPLKDILPKMRSAAFEDLHKAEVASKPVPVAVAGAAPEVKQPDLLALADTALANIKPKIRPYKLAVPEALAAAPSDIKVTVGQATSDTIRPHRRPKSLRKIVASIKAEAGQVAALGTSVASKKSPVNIQKEATERATFSKRHISLVGVYGTPSKRRALVRMPSGRYVKIEMGQKFSGWKVAAIGESSVRITKGSRNQVLRMPK